jgi:hypothetical protein
VASDACAAFDALAVCVVCAAVLLLVPVEQPEKTSITAASTLMSVIHLPLCMLSHSLIDDFIFDFIHDSDEVSIMVVCV